MSYTTNRQPQGISKGIGNLLREGMISEIVAINDYSLFIEQTDNKEVKELFHHIMEDEKRHYGMLLDALRKLDKDEYELQKQAKLHVKITTKEKFKTKSKYSGCILSFIRDAIKGELEAIILYDDIILNIKDDYIISIIKEITKDEKEHVEELTRALVLLDKDSYGPLEN